MPLAIRDLMPYVPAYICRRIVQHPTLSAHAFSDRWHAATLFADISGFTPLSEKLGARGPEGVEQLAGLLNAYFGQIINIIHGHGGDIGRFAGDALLAFWVTEEPVQQDDLVRVATQAGMLVQQALDSFTAPGGDRLSLRVGLGAGEIFTVSLGGVLDRYDCLVTGAAVVEASRAAASVMPGSVAAGENAWKAIGARAKGERIDGEHTRLVELGFDADPRPLRKPKLPPEAEKALLSYVPGSIHRRLAVGQSAWIAEVRRVTVLFVSLHSMDHTVSLEASQTVMQAVQHELYRHEGALVKLGADEKGVTCVCALGLPPAHEDDEVRGALIAHNIKTRLNGMGLSCSVGVNTGRAFCGTIGNQLRSEYSLIADTVNFSARLMAAAKGGVLCGESTFRRAQRGIAWETLEPIPIKGKAQAMPVFRPLGPGRAAKGARSTQPLVGRHQERAAIAEWLAHARADAHGRALVIAAPAGMGKSRLLEHLGETAAARDLRALRGAAEAVQRATPYYAWRSVFQELLGLDPAQAVAEQREKVHAALANEPELDPLAPLLNVVLALDLKDNETTLHMFGEAREISTRRLMARLLARACGRDPLLVILEDAHWMDSASWTFAGQVVGEVAGLALVMATRPVDARAGDAHPASAQALLGSPRTTTLELAPLSPEESLALVEQRWGVTRLPDAIATLMRTRAEGNPFFTNELAAALSSAGIVTIANGAAVVPDSFDPAKLALPESVQGLITGRIDGLTAGEQLTLKVASVVGGAFSPALLAAVCPIDEDRASQERNVGALVQQHLLDPEPEASGVLYSFHHAITREVAYQLMPAAQRRSLHRAVAEWYERRYQADLAPLYPLLARHWSNTDEHARAMDYLEKSGANALRHYANEEAVGFFAQALQIAQRAGGVDAFHRATWQRQLAEAHYNLGHLATALGHFQEALKLLGDPFPASLAGFVAATALEMARQLGHRLIPGLFRARAGDDAPRRLEAARAYERLAQIRYLNNATLPTVHASFKSLNLSESAGDSPELARSYANAAVVHGLLMLHPLARAHARRAIAVSQAVRQQPCEAYVQFICGVYWVTVGMWEEAEQALTRAVHIAEKIGESRRWYESAFTLANTLSRKGDTLRAAQLSADIHEVGRRRGVPQVEVWGLSWELVCRLTVPTDPAVIARLVKQLADCLAAHGDVPLSDQILALAMLAEAAFRRGDAVEAQRRANAALEVIRRTGQVSHYLLAGYYGLAEVYVGLAKTAADPVARWDLESCARALEKVLTNFTRMYPIATSRLWMVRAMLFELSENTKKGEGAWGKALAHAERLRLPVEQMLAHRALARLAGPEGDAARRHEQRALELLTHLARTSGAD